MNNLHPNERQLQRFLNRACNELEYKRIQQHIHTCSGCRHRLHTYLNIEEQLNGMDLLAPSPGLEDRIMDRIRTETNGNHIEMLSSAVNRSKADVSKPRNRLWRPELINGLIATAATYLFISSGILSKIISIKATDWEADMQSRFEQIGYTVHQISMYLTS